MKCRCCAGRSRLLRRLCADCERLVAVFREHCGAPLGSVLDALIATGVARDKIDRFFAYDLDGDGSVQDQLTAAAANQLLLAFGGTAGRQTVAEVERLRRRGAWTTLDKPPSDDSC